MKKCEYCGGETEDEAAYCHGCGTRFPSKVISDHTESPSTAVDLTIEAEGPAGEAQPWTARDAWKCFGMVLVFWLLEGFVVASLRNAFPPLRYWSRTGAGHFIIASMQMTLSVLTALYFARIRSVETFVRAFGLTRPQVRTFGLR